MKTLHRFGALEHCIVDGNGDGLQRDRRVRRLGFAAGLLIQAGLLAVLLILPLLAPMVLPSFLAVVPIHLFRPAPASLPGPANPPSQNATAILYAMNPSRPASPAPHFREDIRNSGVDLGAMEIGQAGDPLLGLGLAGSAQPPVPQTSGEAAASHAPITVSSGVMEALLINRVQPEYPRAARLTGISGAVLLRANIARDGTIQSLRVVSGNPLLSGAAMAAVREWRYKPMVLDGQAVEVETLITVNFVLE